MKRLSMRNFAKFAATGTALILAALTAGNASAQNRSKYANATFILATTANGERSLHFSSNTCDGNLSGEGIFIGINDSCWASNSVGHFPRSMRVRIAPDKISFRNEGKDYVITDAATVKQARELFMPLVSIEEQQSTLGEKQRGLGEKQRDLGEQQSEVKVQVPDMSDDFKKVEADAKRLSAEGGTQSELGDLQSELGDLQSRLGDLQSEAGDMQSKLGDQQSVLGDQQSALGGQQSALSDKVEHIAPGIAEKLHDILSQSIQNGTAKAE